MYYFDDGFIIILMFYNWADDGQNNQICYNLFCAFTLKVASKRALA